MEAEEMEEASSGDDQSASLAHLIQEAKEAEYIGYDRIRQLILQSHQLNAQLQFDRAPAEEKPSFYCGRLGLTLQAIASLAKQHDLSAATAAAMYHSDLGVILNWAKVSDRLPLKEIGGRAKWGALERLCSAMEGGPSLLAEAEAELRVRISAYLQSGLEVMRESLRFFPPPEKPALRRLQENLGFFVACSQIQGLGELGESLRGEVDLSLRAVVEEDATRYMMAWVTSVPEPSQPSPNDDQAAQEALKRTEAKQPRLKLPKLPLRKNSKQTLEKIKAALAEREEYTMQITGAVSEALGDVNGALDARLWDAHTFFRRFGFSYARVAFGALDGKLGPVAQMSVSALNEFQHSHTRDQVPILESSRMSIAIFKGLAKLVSTMRHYVGWEWGSEEAGLPKLCAYEAWFAVSPVFWGAAWQLTLKDYLHKAVHAQGAFEKASEGFNFCESANDALQIFCGVCQRDYRGLPVRGDKLRASTVAAACEAICFGVVEYAELMAEAAGELGEDQTRLLRAANSIDHVGDWVSEKLPGLLDADALFDEANLHQAPFARHMQSRLAKAHQAAELRAEQVLGLYVDCGRETVEKMALMSTAIDQSSLVDRIKGSFVKRHGPMAILRHIGDEMETFRSELLPSMLPVGVRILAASVFHLLHVNLLSAQPKEYYAEMLERTSVIRSLFAEEDDVMFEDPAAYTELVNYLKWTTDLSSEDCALKYCSHVASLTKASVHDTDEGKRCVLSLRLALKFTSTAGKMDLYIQILRASNYFVLDEVTVDSDPYVRLELWPPTRFAPSKYPHLRTTKRENTLRPVWNENLLMRGVSRSVLDQPGTCLQILCADKDSMSSDDVGGRVLVPLKDIRRLDPEERVLADEDLLEVSTDADAWHRLNGLEETHLLVPAPAWPTDPARMHSAFRILVERAKWGRPRTEAEVAASPGLQPDPTAALFVKREKAIAKHRRVPDTKPI